MRRELLTSNSVEWYTPFDLLAEIERFFGVIDLDPCADPGHRVPARQHESEDGLGIPWQGRVFVNPPYGRGIGKWIEKALAEPLDELIGLVPGRFGAKWFRPLHQQTICWMYGRLKFSEANSSAPFDTVLFYRGARREEFERAFAHLGEVRQPKTIPIEPVRQLTLIA